MQTVVFDVMCDGRFVMQHSHKWCPAFPINLEEVVKEVLTKRPTLKGKHIELHQTTNIVKPYRQRFR